MAAGQVKVRVTPSAAGAEWPRGLKLQHVQQLFEVRPGWVDMPKKGDGAPIFASFASSAEAVRALRGVGPSLLGCPVVATLAPAMPRRGSPRRG